MYVNIKKCMLLSKTNFVMMSNIMLTFLLLLFLAGDVEKHPGPRDTPVSETNNKSSTIFHSNYISDIIEDFDIVYFTETHLDYLIPNVNVKCEGFETPIRKDRNSSGGGIILYYKNYVNISRRLDLEHSQVESMWFELKTKLSPILMNINYRSERESHINYWQLFESIIAKALDENSRIICLGDLNKNFMGHLPNNVNDIFLINGLNKHY